MKKVFGVAFVGSLLLAVALWALRHDRGASVAAAPPSVPVAASVAAAGTVPSPVVAAAPGATSTSIATTASPSAPLSDDAACAKLADLCSTSDEKVDVPQCERQLADARKMSGAPNVERSLACLDDAKTCAAATGCISGGVGMGAMGEFLKGLGSAMSR